MDDVSYRSPARVKVETERPESIDERDLSTLVQVRDLLKSHLDTLSHFNMFDTSLTPDQLYIQAKARQESYNLTRPLYDAIKNVVDKIHGQRRG